jgi:hypothetical protein
VQPQPGAVLDGLAIPEACPPDEGTSLRLTRLLGDQELIVGPRTGLASANSLSSVSVGLGVECRFVG